MNARHGMTWLAIPATLALAGCGDPFTNQPFEDDARFVNALPRGEQIEVDEPDASSAARVTPEGGSSTAEAGVDSAAGGSSTAWLELDGSEACPADDDAYDKYRQYTLQMVQNVNGYVYSLLKRLDGILAQPPSARTADSRIWGPAEVQTGVFAQLEVVYTAPTFTYELTLAHAGEAGAALLSGMYWPGSTAEEGQGSFVYDFSVESSYLEDATRQGRMEVVYSTIGAHVDLTVDVYDVGTVDDPASIVSHETYQYFAPGDGSGLFFFTAPRDVGGDPAVLEQMSIWSGWEPSHRGRSTVEVTGGDVEPGTTVAGEECWSGSGDPTYLQEPGKDGLSCGDISTCSASAEGWNEADGS